MLPVAAGGDPGPDPGNDQLLISYRGLRKAVGIIGMILPFVLAIGRAVLDEPVLQPTISDYYYTVMRGWFVGSLCAIGVFMGSYRGYDWRDRAAGLVAAVCAILAALFPTAGEQVDAVAKAVGVAHFIFAAGLFLTLAVFCYLFRVSTKSHRTRQKILRNRIYAVCGVTILLCIGLIVVYAAFLRETAVARIHPVFWLETIAVLAFGVSWLVKGETILKDK